MSKKQLKKRIKELQIQVAVYKEGHRQWMEHVVATCNETEMARLTDEWIDATENNLREHVFGLYSDGDSS